MSANTVQVAISVSQIVGTPLAGGRVQYTATGPAINGGIIVPAPTSVPLDTNGLATANLVPNVSGTQYSVQIYDSNGDLQFTGLATVPATNCNLHDVLNVQALPPLGDAQAALQAVRDLLVATLDTQLKAWAAAQAFAVSSATRNSDGAITAASIVWPDGVTGTYTTDTLSTAFPGATDAWHATYAGSIAKTITQPAVTRDANGAVIAQPAITIT